MTEKCSVEGETFGQKLCPVKFACTHKGDPCLNLFRPVSRIVMGNFVRQHDRVRRAKWVNFSRQFLLKVLMGSD